MAHTDGVHAKIAGQNAFVRNGRNSTWNIDSNGFCLLTEQPFNLDGHDIEESPGLLGPYCVFRIDQSSAVEMVSAPPSDARSHFVNYYSDIAKAAREAYPEAEYVVIGGHIVFDASTSMFQQVKALLGPALRARAVKVLSNVLPCLRSPAKYNPQEKKLPAFGAVTDQHLHVDVSAEWASKGLASSMNDPVPMLGASRLELPVGVISSPTKERRCVTANFWRNTRHESPIKNQHLTVLDAETMSEEELAQTKFKNYAIGGQEQHMLWRLKDQHRLVYFPNMTHDEILVFKQGEYHLRSLAGECASVTYDVVPVAERRRSYIFHTAFADPTAPRDALPRRSIVCPAVMIIMRESEVQPPASKL
jgi:hypothetical protein